MWILLGAALAAPLDDARELLDKGKVAEAIAALERLTRDDPDNGAVWFRLGMARTQRGQPLEAAEAFRRAATLGAVPALSHYNLACALALANLPEQALEALGQALELGFSSVDLLRTDPDLASLRGLPAFRALTAELETVDALRIATGRDGIWASSATLRARLGESCKAGHALACTLGKLDLGDRQALGSALRADCDAGDASACLGSTWTLLEPSATGAFPGPPADRATFVASAQAACDGGLARGCTELGYAYDLGLVAYPNRRKAKELWDDACERLEPRACTALALARGEAPSKDDPVGVLMRSAEADRAGLERACLAGSSLGCARLAARTGALPEPALAATREACHEGIPAACALTAQLDLLAGTISLDQALPRLDEACPILPEACEEADFLRQGAVPVAGYPDPAPPAKEVQRGMFDLKPALHACLLVTLDRDPDAEGWVDLVLRLDPEGRVVGVHVRDPFDETYQTCVTSALRTARIRPTGPNPGRVEVSVPAFHGAQVKLDTLVPGGDGGAEVAQLAKDTPAWAGPLDRCALDQGLASAGDLSLEIALTATRSGTLKDLEIVKSLEEPELERCILDWLSARQVSHPPAIGTPMRARLLLLQPREQAPPDEEPPTFALDSDEPGEPVVVKMLVLSVTRARVDRARGRLSAASLRSIEESHRQMAEAVERMTSGRVRIEPTFRTVDATLRIQHDEGSEGIRRFQLPLDDASFLLQAGIEPGAYDSLMVWGPIPLGFPQPALGVTYQGITLGGATVSSGVIPSRQALRANTGVPAYELPLHEWWHQVEGRAEYGLRLETAWPPLNHEPLKVAGQRLDPRTWLGENNATTMKWYEHVLGSMPRAFWADVWAKGEQIASNEANLARRALPIGEGVHNLAGLNDTILAFGHYAVPATSDDAQAPWFGLWWLPAQRVGRVVAHTGARAQTAGGSWSDAVLEVQDREGGDWRAVEAELTRDGATWTWTFPPREVYRLRLRPLADGVALCREIEAYAE